MKTVGPDIADDDLHAYVDGHLDAAGRARVETFLAAHPEAAARVAAWQSNLQALRDALAWKLAEPVPPSLSLEHLAALRRRGAWQPRNIAAAIAVSLITGAGAGWLAHAPGAANGVAALAQEATSVHQAYAEAQTMPEPMTQAGTAQLVSWASNRLGRHIAPPDLSQAGYTLLGGRMVATTHGPGCMFLYRDGGGNRITVFMRPMDRIDTNAPMRAIGNAGYVWARNGLGASVMSNAALPSLHSLSDTVRSQLDAGA